jgi:hypothetical protein
MPVNKKKRRANRKAKRLEKAREIRSAASLELQALKDGRVSLRDVLEEPENTSLGHVKIYNVLVRAPHLGEAGAKKILLSAKVWPMDRLDAISRWDLDEIMKSLPPRAK